MEVPAGAGGVEARVPAASRAERSGDGGPGRGGVGRTMAAPAGAAAVPAAPARRRWLWSVLAAALGLCE